MKASFDFRGTGVVITGAGQGIGFQMARDFLAEGANVHIWDYSEEALAQAASELEIYSERVRFTKTDITSVASCEAAAASVDRPVRVLINNAGITRDRSFAKLSHEDIEQVIQTNLIGAFNVTKSLLNRFDTGSQQCRVINISSIVGRDGNFGQSNYAAAKAGLLGLTASLSRELGRKGFTVNSVAPGFIDTAMSRAVPEDIRSKLAAQVPLGRFGATDEVSAVCRFLSTKDAGYINGACIAVDGGLHL